MHALETQVDADRQPGTPDTNQGAVVAQVPPGPPQSSEDPAQAVELPAPAEAQVGAHRSAASRANRTSPLSVATQTYSASTATSRTGAGTSSGTVSMRNVARPMSQNPRPLVPAIQMPPPPAGLGTSGASAVTRPSSARVRSTVHRPLAGSRQPSCSGVTATSVSSSSVSATIGARSAGCSATPGGTTTSFVPGASNARPPGVPTHRLSRTAANASTGCPTWPTETSWS